MRSAMAPVLVMALLAGGCDRQSPPAAQGNVGAGNTADDVPPPAPDEVAAPSAAAPKAGSFDATHKGEAAPDFAFRDPAGKDVTLADYRGKPVLLNLWATWCAPCIKEMPSLDALAAREGAKLQVIALAQDLDPSKVAPFWAKGGYKAIRPSLDPKIAFSTGLGANLPTTILYDSRGKEVWRVSGAVDWTGAEAAKALAVAT
ncbi:TlpA family protein disulfide reductase [Sphingomonas cannabina]|uniref:TlpA family protein disulfide reductase n=1 Tax=Sphingomonas cannabina TaxID=2899123 RepID=UPI001F2F5EAE|nr:TlpA disulfide reductase family protein [Sphingomonas cannabina]UIJ45419.1 TlpA family protein disulfide reductase [Sphingomonas cannabina]